MSDLMPDFPEWRDKPSRATPITAARMNQMQDAVEARWLAMLAASIGLTVGSPASASVTTDASGLHFGITLPSPSWVRGALTSGTDLNTITTPGVYRYASGTLTNLPPMTGTVAGLLTVTNLDGAAYTWAAQEFIRYGTNPERWWRVSSNASGSWGAWRRVTDGIPTNLVSGDDANTISVSGVYAATTSAIAAAVANLPISAPGMLEVMRASTGLTIQRYTSYGSSQGMWLRTTLSVSAGTFGSWLRLDSQSGGSSTVIDEAGPYRHTDLLSRARLRRGGRIGTGGLPVVALRFDHHLAQFQSKVLPLLRQYRLPWSQMINPENIGSGDDTMTWADLQSMCLADGGEVWNHGGNHGDATTEAGLRTQIVDSLATLTTNLPSLAIEGWAPPGLADGGYMGASPFKTVAQNTETTAGKLIFGWHALVAGYAPGLYRQLDPTIQPIGGPHYTMDQATLSDITTTLNAVTSNRVGIALMLHPNYLDTDGYMSTATLDAILSDIAARRDAGTISVLSYAGLWLADISSSYRHDLAPLTQSSASVAAGATRTVTLPYSRFQQHYGSTREIAVAVTSSAATTLTIQVGSGTATSHNVPAGTSTIRRYVTLPADLTAGIPIVVTPAAALTVTSIRALAV